MLSRRDLLLAALAASALAGGSAGSLGRAIAQGRLTQ